MVDTELQNILPWQFSNLEIEEDEASLQEKANYKDVQASLTARKGWLTRVNDRCKLDHQYYEKFKLTGQASFIRFSETELSLEIRAAKVANAFRRLLYFTCIVLFSTYDLTWNSFGSIGLQFLNANPTTSHIVKKLPKIESTEWLSRR